MANDMWFSYEEYRARLTKVQAAMRERQLDLVLAFQPESVTYVTGFFTKGYLSYQLAIIPVDRDPIVVCRDVEKYYFDQTAAFPDHALWSDGQDPNTVAIDAIRKVGGATARIGLEKHSWQLTAQRYEALQAGLPGATLVDIGHMIARFRIVKSSAEIAYQQRAARIAEITMAEALAAARAGATERDLAIAVSSAMLRAGSDRAEPGPIASGERALHIHGGFSDRVLRPGDTIHMEVCPHVRHYHARFMRPIKVGKATREEMSLARELLAIQDRALSEVAPGVSAAIPDRIYREGILATGKIAHYPNKTFYSIGFLLHPITGEFLEAAPGCDWRFEAGMTFHTYLILQGLCFSETILITADGYERLTKYPRELLVS